MIATFIGGPIDGRVQEVRDAPYWVIVMDPPNPPTLKFGAPGDRIEIRHRYRIAAVAADDVAYEYEGPMTG